MLVWKGLHGTAHVPRPEVLNSLLHYKALLRIGYLNILGLETPIPPCVCGGGVKGGAFDDINKRDVMVPECYKHLILSQTQSQENDLKRHL